jgi:1-aminocyclopropane-1-carboxylate deaminase
VNLENRLADLPRVQLAILPTPIHALARLTADLAGPQLWIKRDDLTGLAGGGNKTRKLEFLVGDALRTQADTLLTVGAVQSNHTRQTAAAAARAGLHCVLLHNAWTTEPAGPHYRATGNVLLSDLLGAQLYLDETRRDLGTHGTLDTLADRLRDQGRHPYVIPRGGSDHELGSMGYAGCAAEIAAQTAELGLEFDYVLHCTGSSGTQAGLLAGFAALGVSTRVIGVSDSDEVEIKQARVLRLANATLATLGFAQRIAASDVEVLTTEPVPYGVPAPRILDAIRQLARTEGLLADPVYEGRTIRALLDLITQGRLRREHKVLVLHLGGTPAIHGYAEQFGPPSLEPV